MQQEKLDYKKQKKRHFFKIDKPADFLTVLFNTLKCNLYSKSP